MGELRGLKYKNNKTNCVCSWACFHFVSCCFEINLDRTEATDMQTGVGYKAAEIHSHRLDLDGGNSELPCKLHDKQTEKQQHMFTSILLRNPEECQEWSDIGRQTYLRKLHLGTKKSLSRFRLWPNVLFQTKYWWMIFVLKVLTSSSSSLTEVNRRAHDRKWKRTERWSPTQTGTMNPSPRDVKVRQRFRPTVSQCGSVFSQLSTSWRSPGPLSHSISP